MMRTGARYMNRARLLLIEEDHTLRLLLEGHLRQLERFDVEVAEEGEVGIERALLGQFDLILASLHLSDQPPARIIEALAAVRPSPGVIAIARPERLAALDSDRAAALTDVLPLPLKRPMLTDVVMRALQEHQDRLCQGVLPTNKSRSRTVGVLSCRRKGSALPLPLGHYQLSERLGDGPKGSVYRGIDRRNEEAVAVRAIPRAMLERLGRGTRWFERFSREASSAAVVNHPGLAVLLDHGFEDDQRCLFVVYELARGERLSERLERGPLELTEALRVTLQLAAALAAVHSSGFSHRLVRPTNIHIDDQGDVTLTDVGVSGMLAWDLMPLRDRLLGTPYDSPEQLRLGRSDDRSDQFSLGMILYESLTGRYPYSGESPSAKVHAITTSAPKLIFDEEFTERDQAIELLERMLAFNPDERFQSDVDLREALEQLAQEME